MTRSPFLRAALLAMMIFGAAACDHPSPPTAAEPTPQATPDKQGIVFGDGFHKEEASPTATLRWVQQNAALRVIAPTEGHYRLTFRPFTVFSTVENTIEVSANGQPTGSFSTRVFDLSNPTPATVEVPLRAGDNDLRLHSKGPENRMSDTDDRMVAYGLVVPIVVERAP